MAAREILHLAKVDQLEMLPRLCLVRKENCVAAFRPDEQQILAGKRLSILWITALQMVLPAHCRRSGQLMLQTQRKTATSRNSVIGARNVAALCLNGRLCCRGAADGSVEDALRVRTLGAAYVSCGLEADLRRCSVLAGNGAI